MIDFAKCFYIVAQKEYSSNHDVFRKIFLYLRLRVRLTSSINGRLEHKCLSVYAGKIQNEEGNQKIICSVGKKEAASACLA